MKDQLTLSLEIARLQHRKGDLQAARFSAEEALSEALNCKNMALWIDAARLVFQCSYELDELSYAQGIIEQVMHFHRTSIKEQEQAPAENLIAAWLLANGKQQESEIYLDSAISKATQAHDLDTLARALLTLSVAKAASPSSYRQCLHALEKLDVIVAELENPEMILTANLLRAFIYTQTEKFDLALDLLWKSYEDAKIHGFNLLIPGILIQMARLHRDQGHDEQFRIYAELALRGTDKNKLPRIYRAVAQVCPNGVPVSRPQPDFVIEEASRIVREKNKGQLDFKNQHILFDLALLFIKNPGQRYSKEDLVETIWRQVYDPDMHDNLIYVSIKRLRTLIEPDLESPQYILRDRKGYYFNPQSLVQFKNPEEATT